MPITTSNLGNEDETQDEGGTNQESGAEESSKYIDKLHQGVGGDDDDCQHNAGHIDGCCNVLGVIQALNLHFAYCEGQHKGDNLEHHLVTIEDTQEDVSASRAADVCEVDSGDGEHLGNLGRK